MQNPVLDGRVKKSAKGTIEAPPMFPGPPLRSHVAVRARGQWAWSCPPRQAFLLPTYTVSPALGPSELYSAHRAAGMCQGFTAPGTALTKEGLSGWVNSTLRDTSTMCSPSPSASPHGPPISGSFTTFTGFSPFPSLPVSLPHPFPPASKDHLPNKLPALKFLSQNLFSGNPN